MDCPQCGKEMEHGHFHLPTGVVGIKFGWAKEGSRSRYFGGNQLGKEPWIAGYRCRKCNVMTLLFSAEGNNFELFPEQ